MLWKSVVIEILLRRQCRICELCKEMIEENQLVDVDHVVPSSQDGPDAAKNLRVVHTSCHRKRKMPKRQVTVVKTKRSLLPDTVYLQTAYGELLLLKQIQDTGLGLAAACRKLSISVNRVAYYMKKHRLRGRVNLWPKIQLVKP